MAKVAIVSLKIIGHFFGRDRGPRQPWHRTSPGLPSHEQRMTILITGVGTDLVECALHKLLALGDEVVSVTAWCSC